MKKLLKKISVLLLTLSLVACGSTGGGDGGTGGLRDTMYIGIQNTVSGFNPFNNTEAAANWIMRMMYPTLLDQPESTVFEPNIAESFDSEDGQNYTIKIKADANWSDGKPITADDVAYTLNLAAQADFETSYGNYLSSLDGVGNNGKLAAGVTSISGVAVVDDKTLTLKTKVPVDPNYLKELIGFNIFIAPKHVVETMDVSDLGSSEFATKPTVFGGPYKFVAYETGSYVQLEANESYHKGTPKTKNLYVKIMDATSLVTEIQSGGVDLLAGGGIGTITPSDAETLRNVAGVVVEDAVGFNGQFMYINNDHFKDAKVRQAITHAINRQRIVDELLKGDGAIMPSILPTVSPYFAKDIPALEYDVEKAKALLAESGFDTSKEINLVVPTGNTVRQQSASLIEQDLEAAGFNVKQTTYDFATMVTHVKEGNYDLSLMGLSFNSEPDNAGYFSTTGASNYLKLTDTTIDELWAKGKALTSKEERLPVYHEIQKYFIENANIVGLYSPYQYIVRSEKVTGGIKPFWAGSLADIHNWTVAE